MSNAAEILVIEDNPGDQRLTLEALKEAPWAKSPHIVSNGTDAVHFLRREGRFSQVPKPDMVILDLHLPGDDGHQILEIIKADPKLKAIPVVIFSTAGETGTVGKSYELGAACYLRKPADADAYFRTLGNLESLWESVEKSTDAKRLRKSRAILKRVTERLTPAGNPVWWGIALLVVFLLVLLLR